MPQPIPTPFSAPLSTTAFFVPLPFAAPGARAQEPTNTTDRPADPGAQDPTAGQTQAPGPQQQPQPVGPCAGDSNMLVFLGVGFLLMYLLMLRPEQKRRKAQQELLASIKVGDRVVTLGGMHGEVASLTDKTVTLRVDTVRMTFDRTAVARVERDEAAGGAAKS